MINLATPRCRGIWPLFLGYGTGIIVAAHCPAALLPPLAWSCWLIAAATLLGCYIVASRTLLLPITALAVALGVCAFAIASHPPPDDTDLTALTESEPLRIRGQVLAVEPQSQQWRMIVAMEQIATAQHRATVAGKLRIQVERGDCHVLPGDRIAFQSRLRSPRRFGTPAEFDYPRHLAAAKIFLTGYLSDSDQIAIIAPVTELPWLLRIERWRSQLGQDIARHFETEQSACLLSLTLGQKSRLSTSQRDALSAAGISHLFSISGLHLGLFATLLYLVINALYRRSDRLLNWLPAQLAVPFIAAPLLLGYVLLSGGALPAWRALLIIIVALLARLWRRQTPNIQMLALVALTLLAITPLALFSASFQLSFGGVAALLLCLPPWQRRFKSPWQRWLLMPILASVAATLATTPLVIHHFHIFAPAAFLCNLFAIPLIGLIAVPLALGGVLIFTLAPTPAVALLRLSMWFIDLTLELSGHLAHGILAAMKLYYDPLALVLCATICLILLSLLAWQYRLAQRIGVVGGVLLLILYATTASAPLMLTPLSVGQGDSLLLTMNNRDHYLIDGGGLRSDTFDCGERLVAPALGWLGVRRLKAVILSHDHPDHRKGLIHILDQFAVDDFWCSLAWSELDSSLQQVLLKRSIPFHRVAAGWTELAIAGDGSLALFAPPDDSAAMNDRSLVVYAGYERDGLLLTGDLEKYGVAQLLAQPLPGPVTVLKLPHHGSRRSSPQHLLETIQPEIAIACVGYNNNYGFPHREVITAVERCAAQLLRTDLEGTKRLSSAGQGWKMTTLATPQ